MSMKDCGVRDRLLASAREAFLDKGFRGASLRGICQRAGVTTGAMYYFFHDKEELFSALVEKPLRQLQRLSRQAAERELADLSAFTQTEEQLIDFLLRNREACILLLEKADGTRYAGFKDACQRELERLFSLFFQKYGAEDVDAALVHLIVSMRIRGYLDMLCGGYPGDKMRVLARDMGVYADAGFRALTRFLRESKGSEPV